MSKFTKRNGGNGEFAVHKSDGTKGKRPCFSSDTKVTRTEDVASFFDWFKNEYQAECGLEVNEVDGVVFPEEAYPIALPANASAHQKKILDTKIKAVTDANQRQKERKKTISSLLMRYLPPEAQTIIRRQHPTAEYEGNIAVIAMAFMSALSPDAPLSDKQKEAAVSRDRALFRNKKITSKAQVPTMVEEHRQLRLKSKSAYRKEISVEDSLFDMFQTFKGALQEIAVNRENRMHQYEEAIREDPLNEADYRRQYIRGLPVTIESFTTYVKNYRLSQQYDEIKSWTTSLVTQKLDSIGESGDDDSASESAFLTTTSTKIRNDKKRKDKTGKKEVDVSKITCHTCKKLGHFAAKCPQKEISKTFANLSEDEKAAFEEWTKSKKAKNG